jgi:hypothetical protein
VPSACTNNLVLRADSKKANISVTIRDKFSILIDFLASIDFLQSESPSFGVLLPVGIYLSALDSAFIENFN